MSTEGLNIGTWIPSCSMSGVTFISGFEGRGRVYGAPVQGRQDLLELIERVRALQGVEHEPQCSYPAARA